MTDLIKKYSKIIIAIVFTYIGYTSCSSDQDSYKEFIKDGEISYTGKIDSLKIYSGKDRVKVEGLFISDPKITECRIFWNIGADSVSIPVNRTSGVDTLRTYINGLGDNIYSFTVFTYDALGNKSIPVSGIGQSYADRYQASLNNRPIISSNLFAKDLSLTASFGSMDLTTGVIATEIHYTDEANIEQIITLPIDESEVQIPYILDGKFKHRSVFIPNEKSIDTFYSDFVEVSPEVTYMKNFAFPFKAVEGQTGRWRDLADWTANEAAKNHNGQGGWDNNIPRGDRGYFNIETDGWGAGNSITNAKIYQTAYLEPGSYTFKCNPRLNGDGSINSGYTIPEDFVYLVASEGPELPDVVDIETNSLAFVRISRTMDKDALVINFTLSEAKEVSFGMASTQGDKRYMPVTSFSFTKDE